jgi:PAS domain S-box-containing protein
MAIVNDILNPMSNGKIDTHSKIKDPVKDLENREKECVAQLALVENMDKINRAIQSASTLEDVMRDVLSVTLTILDCDRAWLFYPCDPDALMFRVPMEVTKPEYPGAGILKEDVPMPPDMAENLREALLSAEPLAYVVGTERPVNKTSAEQFGVKSMLMTALNPKIGKPWVFGIHQCSHARVWTDEEKRLLQEISRRLADGLTSTLLYRDLQISESKFSAAFRSSPDLMAITQIADGKIIEVNEGYTRMLGYTHEESVGKTTSELSIWADSADRAKLVVALQKNGKVLDFETALRRKDGTIVPVIDSASLFDFQGEKHILSVAHDITGRKKAEMDMAQKNRMLRILSNINQALIHVKDEAILLSEACRIVGESGGYRMLWIGFKENDTEKTVRPVAYAGFESGYLESAHITWSDTEHGRGPVGVALRTGQLQMVRDISTEQRMAPWHKAALERGYKSLAVFPFKDGDQVFGALSIYADKTDAFSEDEIKILHELASDLAFGIISLRTVAERKVLEEELLQASADRYKAICVSSRDAIMTLEPPEWKFTSGNPATIKMFGMKSEGDFLIHEPWSLSPERQPDGRNSAEKAKEMIGIAMRDGTNFFEWVHRRANGEDFPAEVLLSKVKQKGKQFIHAVVRDITERKRLEEKSKGYAEEKFKVIFDNTNDGIVLVDVKTRMFYLANDAFCRMLGYSQKEVRELSIEDIHPKEDLPNCIEQFDKQVRKEIQGAECLRIKRKDGSIFYSDINSSPVTLEGGVYLLGIFRDITSRKEAETKEKEYIEGVENMNKLMIGRELKMIELKGEIEKLKQEIASKK